LKKNNNRSVASKKYKYFHNLRKKVNNRLLPFSKPTFLHTQKYGLKQ